MERHFTYVGGTSSKFWEVKLDGTTVTVRFGRIGTNGQSQTKVFPDDAAATAHRDRLVAEKLAKGYVEDPGATPAAPVAVTPTPKAPEPALTDEDAWVVPAAWWRHTEPWRGRGPIRTVTLDSAEAARAEDLLGRAEFLEDMLRNPQPDSDPEIVERARRHLGIGCARTPEPVGAVLTFYFGLTRTPFEDRARLWAVVDGWAAAHGVGFAAEAAAMLDGIDLHLFSLNRRRPGGQRCEEANALLSRARRILAAADQPAYDDAVQRLERARAWCGEVRSTTSYLLPTQQAWVAEDVEFLKDRGAPQRMCAGLLGSVADPKQAQTLLRLFPSHDVVAQPGLLYSLAAHVGPEVGPSLLTLYDECARYGYGEHVAAQKTIARIVAQLPDDEALSGLLRRHDGLHIRAALMEALTRFPDRVRRVATAAAAGSGPETAIARELLRTLSARTGAVSPETAGAVPPLLAAPPWMRRKGAAKPVVVEGLTAPQSVAVTWQPGERESWAALRTGWSKSRLRDWPEYVAAARRDPEWIHPLVVAYAPADLARPLLADRPAVRSSPEHLQRVLARWDEEAAGYVVSAVLQGLTPLAEVCLPLRDPGLALPMAERAVRRGSARTTARAWLLRHPEVAAHGLIPPALGKPGKDRTNAEAGLRLLDRDGHGDTVRAVSAAYGAQVAGAVAAMLALDPVDVVPTAPPKLPVWLGPTQLPPVWLHDRSGVLPEEALGNLCRMLALCKPDETYAGIDALRPALDAASLAELAWSMLERWRTAGYPVKETWILGALSAVGGDEGARRLAPLVTVWAREGARSRAAAALDALGHMGSDTALLHLYRLARALFVKPLKQQAQQLVAGIADSLGLTEDELADRLVPDLGLDADGRMLLDYGPRRFRVGFDESLQPTVHDEDGTRRKLLPRPSAQDDPALAEPAYARFSGLKKDIKTVAAEQIRRLERAMAAGRRWSATEHRALFVEHPLTVHLARRLVWVTLGAAGRVTGSFRIAEDRTFADCSDAEVKVPDDAVVGIAHPLHLGPDLGAWGDLFADYEILQPFPQLGRETYAFTSAERSATSLERFAGLVVYTGRLLALGHRGWDRGLAHAYGIHDEVIRPADGGRHVTVHFGPGIEIGATMAEKEQTLHRVEIRGGVWGDLDPVTASEVLRDLESLRG